VGTAVLIAHAKHEPRAVALKLSDEGLALGENTFYPMKALSGFAVLSASDGWADAAVLVLEEKRGFAAPVKVFAPARELPAIRAILGDHLPEIEYEESLTDHLFRLLRF